MRNKPPEWPLPEKSGSDGLLSAVLNEPVSLGCAKRELLYQILAGERSILALVRVLGGTDCSENRKFVQKMINSGDFQTELMRAQRDVVSSAMDRIKAGVHRRLAKMEELAEKAKEERTQFLAAKDLLDRAGTGAAQKIAVSTPAQYAKLAQDFLKPVKGDEDGAGKE